MWEEISGGEKSGVEESRMRKVGREMWGEKSRQRKVEREKWSGGQWDEKSGARKVG